MRFSFKTLLESSCQNIWHDVLRAGKQIGAAVEVPDAEATRILDACSEPPKPQPQKAVPAIPFGQWPIPFRFLAAKAKPEETGLGDVIERLVGPIGGNTFKIWYKRITGKNCGCGQRKQKLNELYPLLKDD